MVKKGAGSKTRKDKAASPVTGVIVVVAIAVLLSVIIYVFVLGAAGGQNGEAVAGVTVNDCCDGKVTMVSDGNTERVRVETSSGTVFLQEVGETEYISDSGEVTVVGVTEDKEETVLYRKEVEVTRSPDGSSNGEGVNTLSFTVEHQGSAEYINVTSIRVSNPDDPDGDAQHIGDGTANRAIRVQEYTSAGTSAGVTVTMGESLSHTQSKFQGGNHFGDSPTAHRDSETWVIDDFRDSSDNPTEVGEVEVTIGYGKVESLGDPWQPGGTKTATVNDSDTVTINE